MVLVDDKAIAALPGANAGWLRRPVEVTLRSIGVKLPRHRRPVGRFARHMPARDHVPGALHRRREGRRSGAARAAAGLGLRPLGIQSSTDLPPTGIVPMFAHKDVRIERHPTPPRACLEPSAGNAPAAERSRAEWYLWLFWVVAERGSELVPSYD